VHVSSTPGDYDNEAGGSAADNYTVLGTGPTARITVTAQTNHPPVCPNDSFTTNQNTAHSGSVTCTDADGNPLTYALVAGPAHGTLVFNSDGTYTYTPSSGYSGPDSFQYKANDGTADSNTATVSITVLAGDTTPPVCDAYSSGKDENGKQTYTFLIQDTGSGLKSVEVTHIVNSTWSLPDFEQGTTDRLTGIETWVRNGKPAALDLRITDVAGNVTDCDPLIATVKIDRRLKAGRHTVVQSFTAVPQAESKLLIVNGRPGLKRLRVTVNGRVFWFNRLKPGQILRYDFAKAMRPGSHNTIRVRAYGKAGASARIELSNLS
jgi:VCBS repeat-containing protein